MTKKFLSLVLALALVVGLLPVMGVQAAESVYRADTFENYTTFEFNQGYTGQSVTIPTGDDDSTGTWTLGADVSMKIVDTVGYDGKSTKAAEITIKSDSSGTSASAGSLRFGSTIKSTTGVLNAGICVQEFDVYLPAGADHSWQLAPIYVHGLEIGFGTGYGEAQSTRVSVAPGWHRVVCVVLADETGNNQIGYVDGQLVVNRKYSSSLVQPGFQFMYKKDYDRTIMIDNVKIWQNPDPTVALSGFAGEQDVEINEDITVGFDNMLLETSVSSDCVTMSDAAGNPVEIESVEPSADNKSIIIKTKSDLTANTNYSVTVSGLADMYDQDIPSYSFSFKTAAPNPIEMTTDPTFTKVDLFNRNGASTTVNALENGYISVEYTVGNTSDDPASSQSVIMLVVLKTGDTIEGFQFKDATLTKGQSLTFKGGFNVTDADNQSIECYTWNTLYGMKPLADKYTITKTDITH